MEVIAHNLANTQTPGYKKDGARFSDFVSMSTYTQMDQGPVHSTGNPLDVALEGEGFLQVQGPNGAVYTRAGNLTLNSENILVTQSGLPVMGQGGPIQLQDSTIRIERNGQIFDRNNNPVDTLAIVKFSKDTVLEKVGSNCFRPMGGNAESQAAEGCTIQQGAIEDSNLTAVEEMVRMISTMRAFEAYQKVMQSSFQQDSQLINKLGS
jgi:flagellar basal-body rod protein FlgG